MLVMAKEIIVFLNQLKALIIIKSKYFLNRKLKTDYYCKPSSFFQTRSQGHDFFQFMGSNFVLLLSIG